MPSVNKTTNLGLNQWAGNEYPKRLDFVEDNATIDAAVGKLANLTTDDKTNLVAALNEHETQINSLEAEIDTHKGEKVSHGEIISRDISLTGIQIVSGLPFKPKIIRVIAYIWNTKQICDGFYVYDNNLQICRFKDAISGNYQNESYIVAIANDGSNIAKGLIQNVGETSFEINWSKTGSPTGTANIIFEIIGH